MLCHSQEEEKERHLVWATVEQIVRVGHRDGRPGGSSGDKQGPALTGLRPEIRAQSCRWTTLSYRNRWVSEGRRGICTAGTGAGPEGARWVQGLGLERGEEKPTHAAWWGYWIGRQRRVR